MFQDSIYNVIERVQGQRVTPFQAGNSHFFNLQNVDLISLQSYYTYTNYLSCFIIWTISLSGMSM